MKEIKLTYGEIALVDDEDYEYLNQWKWHTDHDGYAIRGGWLNGKKYNYRMHRVILGLTDSKIQTDHRDHNLLNNQKSNIRACTHSENQRNKIPKGRSKYLGVMYQKRHFKTTSGRIFDYEEIIARIRINGKYKRIGRFNTEEEAALAYNKYAEKYFEEFANLNKISKELITNK